MFQLTMYFMLALGLTSLTQVQAFAWEHRTLPTSFTQSSTAHYGGNKAPFVLSPSHVKVIAPSAAGMFVWSTQNDGISWTSNQLPTSNIGRITRAFLASDTLALGWSESVTPTMFHFSATSNTWGAASHAWPLANWNIIDVSTSSTGDMIVLATTPALGKLVEGELFTIYGNEQGWSTPTRLSHQDSLVGDAAIITHPTGLQSVVWSQRYGNAWDILVRNSNDQQLWSSPTTIVQNIAAPYFQEAAVQLAADTLNQEEVALAFTGWSMQSHSQLWSKAFDATSGLTTQTIALLPDAGDMAIQPSLVSLTNNTWAVAWQQKIGIDVEIFVAQHEADGTWSNAVNVSTNPNHIDRDPHIAIGSSQTLNIAFTQRIQADIQEVYTFVEGNIHDSTLDSDDDGIPDTQESGFDLNSDGIDDALSARVATWLSDNGRYALIIEGNGELHQVQAPIFGETGLATPYDYDVHDLLFAFEIHALSQNESTQVHLITPYTLAADTTWLKLNPNAQWSDSASNSVYLDTEQTGLVIHLTDGGAGDEDGISNGIIVDPAVLATPKAIHTISNTTAIELSTETISETQAASCLTPNNKQPAWFLWVTFLMTGIIFASRKAVQQSI